MGSEKKTLTEELCGRDVKNRGEETCLPEAPQFGKIQEGGQHLYGSGV